MKKQLRLNTSQAITVDLFAGGGTVGTARIVNYVDKSESRWLGGKSGFVLADPHPLPFLPPKGMPGLFDIEEHALLPAEQLAEMNF